MPARWGPNRLKSVPGSDRPAESKVLLIHGAATTARIWAGVRQFLPRVSVLAPQRPCSGDLATELAALRPLTAGALVMGVGGGATLALALAAEPSAATGFLLHEPAVGSLVPGLLAPLGEALRSGGVTAFGAVLYGKSWQPEMAPSTEAVIRDFEMFRAFEPPLPDPGHRVVFTTVGEYSPPIRLQAAQELTRQRGIAHFVLPRCAHSIHLDHPHFTARLIMEALAGRLPHPDLRP